MVKEKEEKQENVEVGGISIKTFKLTLCGTSPLISHKFSDRAQDAMLAKQMKTAIKTPGKEAKNPQRDYEESLYRHKRIFV